MLVEGDKEINHRILPLLAGKVRFRGGVRTHPQGFSLLFEMPFILHRLLAAPGWLGFGGD